MTEENQTGKDIAPASGHAEGDVDTTSGVSSGSRRPRSGRSGRLIGFLAVLLALMALAGGGYLWWLLQLQIKATNNQIAALTRQLGALSADVRQVGQQSAPRTSLDALSSQTSERLQDLSTRTGALESALENLRNKKEGGRTIWLHSEIEFLLRVASDQVQINHNADRAVAALQAADERLHALDDPALLPVRKRIADEISALQAIPRPDIDGMALALLAMSTQVQGWPLQQTAPEHYTPSESANGPAATAHWYVRLWHGLTGALHNMVTIHHRDTRVQPLLSPKEAFFLRRNLELTLQSARAALLQRDAQAFDNSIKTARDWLKAHFDTSDSGVASAIASLEKMGKDNISPVLPDVSASLGLMQKIEARKGTQ